MMIGCMRLNDVSVICRVVNPHQTSEKMWGGLLYGVNKLGNDFGLIPTVEMETRNRRWTDEMHARLQGTPYLQFSSWNSRSCAQQRHVSRRDWTATNRRQHHAVNWRRLSHLDDSTTSPWLPRIPVNTICYHDNRGRANKATQCPTMMTSKCSNNDLDRSYIRKTMHTQHMQ